VQIAAVAATHPPLPLRLRIMSVPVGSEVKWQLQRQAAGTSSASIADPPYPIVASATAACPTSAAPLVLAAPLHAGKYLAELSLDVSESAASWPTGCQPDPLTGELLGTALPQPAAGAQLDAASALQWSLVFLPSADDRACPIVADDSRARYDKEVAESWAVAAAATGYAASTSAPSAVAAVPAPGGGKAKGGAAVMPAGVPAMGGPGAARAAAAAAALGRAQQHPQHSADGSGQGSEVSGFSVSEAAGLVSLRHISTGAGAGAGGVLQLRPGEHTHVDRVPGFSARVPPSNLPPSVKVGLVRL
jgi:hypothetical protein